MNEKQSKERRRSIRVPLISESCYWSSMNFKSKESAITDISEYGLFIKTSFMPEIKENIRVIINLPSDLGQLDLTAKVIIRRWAVSKKSKLEKGFAVEFVNVPEDTAKILGSLCIYLRNKQIIEVSKRIIEEFFT